MTELEKRLQSALTATAGLLERLVGLEACFAEWRTMVLCNGERGAEKRGASRTSRRAEFIEHALGCREDERDRAHRGRALSAASSWSWNDRSGNGRDGPCCVNQDMRLSAEDLQLKLGG
ncbi:hypothetical protein [Pantoea stewartii]|uniref:hypothetical protein n=1 Tax=Pantoea stewartii TaxID=66269 RepID=UPI0025A153B5|nr:hypothetical protein [Pantoea stewartii]